MTVERMTTGPLPIAADLQGNAVTRWAAMLVPAAELAATIADTDFVPESIRGNPAAVTAVILYGDELGIGPMQALASVDFIKGKPSPSAALVRALILRAGHSFLIHESTGVRCKVSGLRKGRPETERQFVEWTLDMARSAGLLSSGGTWQRYPRALLLARATTELGRGAFPDVMRGLGGIGEGATTVEEVAAWPTDGDAAASAPTAEATTVQRSPRKRATGKKAAAGQVVPENLQPLDPQRPPDGGTAADSTESVPAVVPPQTTSAKPAGQPPAPPAGPQPDADTEAPLPPKMATKGLLRAYHASFKEAGITDADRELRLAVTSHVVGREVTSSTELTRLDVLKVTGALAEVITGAAEIGWDTNGQVVITSTREDSTRADDYDPRTDPDQPELPL